MACCSPDGSLEVSGANGDSDATHPAVQLHDTPTLMDLCKIPLGDGASAGGSVGMFGATLLGHSTYLLFYNISADALVSHGLGDTRLKDVKLQMTVRHFTLRALALHYLRMSVVEGRYEEISRMAR